MTAITALARASSETVDLYTPLPEASAGNRCDEGRLREVVRFAGVSEEFLVRLLAQPLVLWRPLATPNREFDRYLALARALSRPALVLETRQDWFTPALNLSKRALAKLTIAVGQGRDGAPRTRSVKVAPLYLPGKPRIGEVRCYDGTPLVEFHHGLCQHLRGFYPDQHALDARLLDQGAPPRLAYERAFALFTCLGALAESFVWEGPELNFTESVVLPAYEATVRRFGRKPTIIRLLPEGTETDPFWETYPAEVLPLARQAARRCSCG